MKVYNIYNEIPKYFPDSFQTYTMALFLLQYGIPVPLLITYYFKTWFVIYNSTKTVISSMMSRKKKRTKSNDSMVTETTLITGE